jgi:hypothetical protein
MSKFIEPSNEEIKLEKLYQDMGLSDKEYDKVFFKFNLFITWFDKFRHFVPSNFSPLIQTISHHYLF